MQKIIPHLWYDKEAVEAAQWYVSLFEDSRIISSSIIPDTPSGDAQTVDFQLAGMRFSAISAGPYFALNPSISLMVACRNAEEVDRLYASLSADGTELMPLGEYPFSKHYAWIQDKYGLSWQLMLVGKIEEHQRIRPSLLFAEDACGKAEEAINYYLSVFEGSNKGYVNYYKAGEPMDERAKINYSELNIRGNQFIAMDHGFGGDFTFNEAFSFMIPCEDQEEIDYFWDKLSFVPEAEQCGWVKDQFGVSWQIVPENMNDIMANGTKEEVKRMTEAFLQMKKLDIAALEKARLFPQER
ncbi:Glyoxalase superfamily enzyme, possibly 3-demethylubiquinone-9 3-methyltransferase [Anaerocolumna jejuensis DSM 15929]|uniref:Glyoxalase superfamily enzyme, possibly 3-demethylubiquinone-9 3-methyltransferase n=1 Tax=Anaerocolumna jejuensis DSM 15929 TaxID=1121322 RepID=A0A1M6WAY0_9FIRM|nr:VOC family protein [Anaerocolumna jejuensis]SHK90828.1 Glyoxalase superfamily enzyme, possibly 3-demethylubiquinone-9 3-methyltransferase [Anaerocolumna jejuensis DSM 15929]